MRTHNIPVAACLALFICACSAPPDVEGLGGSTNEITIEEASGVIFRDGALCIVDDSIPSAYFRVQIPEGTRGLIRLNELKPEKVMLPQIGPFIDLEAIDCLADGRMVVLSERLRCIVDDQGIVAEYDYPLSEVGRRGLEGLAVRPLPDGSSRIAVLWEGGYPDQGSLHPQLEGLLGGRPMAPLIYVHDLKPGEVSGRVRWERGQQHFMLQPPRPEGDEPNAQRFRAPELVWYRWPDAAPDEWGFIVLLSSQNAVDRPQFLHHWLQRFDLNGVPIGSALDIAAYTPEDIGSANWEGLCWYEEGQSLVLVHEGRGEFQPNAFILDLPADWQYTPTR